MSLKNEDEIKTFSDMQKLKKSSDLHYKKYLKEIVHTERK